MALDQAMRLFWRQGYEATSIQDLVDRLGINRFSLYDTFGSKHELFIAACERFRLLMNEERINELENASSGLEGIRKLFRTFEGSFADGKKDCGCLMTNSVVEMAMHDNQVRTWAQEFLQRLEDALCHALTKARRAGEISTSKSPRELARYFTCLLQGINVIGKAFPDGKQVRKVLRTAISELE